MNKTTLICSIAAVSGVLALAGCVGSTAPVPTTTGGCKAEYDATIDRAQLAATGQNALGAGMGMAVVKGKAEADYNACVARVANGAASALPDVAGVSQTTETVTDGQRTTESYTYGTPPRPASTPAATEGESCRRRDVLSGGSGYFGCVGG